MLGGSQQYNILFYGSTNNTGFTRTSKHHSFRKEVQDSKGANICPFIFVLTSYLKLREKRLIVLKETARKIRRQFLEILRLILFIPTGYPEFFNTEGNSIYEKPWVVSPEN